ncbi:MAG TPA: hypothetical protein DCM05_08625 [Elusimicrobia bacterium]|nr:hypothetical protein [Elusimicrobiota bacterium]
MCMALASSPASAAPDKYPDGYWERGYGFSQSAVYYQVNLKVKDIAKAEAEAVRLLTQAGAVSSGGSGMGTSNGNPMKSLSFTMDSTKAGKSVKKLFDLGDLQSYNSQAQTQKSTILELEQKIKDLSAEIAANASTLSEMPIASHLMNSLLKRLKQSRDTYQAAIGRASVNLQLIQASPEEKRP